MRKSNREAFVFFTPGFYIALAVTLLIVPLRWVVSWYTALFAHELFHYCAVRACGKNVYQIRFRLQGAFMDTDGFTNLQSIFCALAGPLAGILLLFTGRWFPRLAVCGLLQSLYNLLPVFPLDGGRALRGFVCSVLELRKGERVCRYIGNTAFCTLIALAVYAVVHLKLGLLPLVFVVLLYLKNIKTTCKASTERVK